MEARIVEFAEILRQNGVRVGTSEVLDAVAACQQTGLDRREDFRSALRTTLVKRGSDLVQVVTGKCCIHWPLLRKLSTQ